KLTFAPIASPSSLPILFSKPSSLSLEKGILPGSAEMTSCPIFFALKAALAAALIAICSLGVRSSKSLLRSRLMVLAATGVTATPKAARQKVAAPRMRLGIGDRGFTSLACGAGSLGQKSQPHLAPGVLSVRPYIRKGRPVPQGH